MLRLVQNSLPFEAVLAEAVSAAEQRARGKELIGGAHRLCDLAACFRGLLAEGLRERIGAVPAAVPALTELDFTRLGFAHAEDRELLVWLIVHFAVARSWKAHKNACSEVCKNLPLTACNRSLFSVRSWAVI